MVIQHGSQDKFSANAYADVQPGLLISSKPGQCPEANLLEFLGKYPLSHRKLNIETILIFILHSNGMTGSELTKLFNCSASKISKSIANANNIFQTSNTHKSNNESENFLLIVSCVLKKYAISIYQQKSSNSNK